MNIQIHKTAAEMAQAAADKCAAILNSVLSQKPTARLLLSTGASQLPFFERLIKAPIDFSRIEMFHLDEYIGIDDTHPASFKKYLTERFVIPSKVDKAHLIDGLRPADETIDELTDLLAAAPIDLGLIGIGENSHIAFNDPPADFDCEDTYKVVDLSDTCKAQQVREGWFADMDSVPKQALTMTCRQILKCERIISIVPYAVKASTVYDTLTQDVNNTTPATLLKTHADCSLMLDADSASMLFGGKLKL